VAHDLIELSLVDLWALLRFRIERIADGAFPGALAALFHELIVDFFFHEHTRSGATALAWIEEETEVSAFDSIIETAVPENDVRTLSAEFQRHALQIASRCGLHDQVTDFGCPGKGDLIDTHVPRDGCTCRRSVSWQEIYDAFRESSFDDQFADA